MPLVDLRTNLKSLKYGHDRPGGGSSDQPYIQTDINDPTSTIRNLVARGSVIKIGAKELKEIRLFNSELSKTIGTLIDTAVNFDDGFIRGGAIRAANDSITDLFRVGKFLTDLPKGPLFIAKQVGLQLSNPRVEASTQPTNKPTNGPVGINNIINFVSNTANKIENTFGPTRLYNLGINTIAQVPLTAFGGHIARHGFLPNNDDSKYYENVITTKNFQNKTSRLLDLTTNFNLGPAGINKGEVTKTGITGAFAQLGSSLLSGNLGSVLASSGILAAASGLFAQQNTIDDYLGGPNSVYGIGRTTIMRKADTENKEKIDFSLIQSSIFAGKTLDSKNYPLDSNLGRLLGVSNQSSSILQNIVSSSSGPISSNDFYVPVNLNDKTWKDNDTYSVLNSVFFAGKTRKEDGTPEEIDYTRGLGSMGERAISSYSTDIPTGSNEIEGGVFNTAVKYNPGTKRYSELVSAIQTTTNASNYIIAGGGDRPGPAPLYGIINSETLYQANKNFGYDTANETNVDKFNLSTVNYSGSGIVYQNTYGQKVSFKPPSIDTNGKTQGFNWSSIAREQRVGDLGTQAIRVKRKTTTTDSSGNATTNVEFVNRDVKRADAINLTPMFKGGSYYSGDSIDINGVPYNTRDFAKFVIQSVLTSTPDESFHMVFRALLTGLQDSVDAKWNDINYVGRGTPFYIYTGTTRKISFKFKVAALSAQEMGPIYTKLNYLMSSIMPDYNNTTSKGVMRGGLHRLTIGNYLDAQLGIITSLSYSIPDDAPWEIALDEPEGGAQVLILPHIIEVSVDFTPIGVETKGFNKVEDRSTALSYIAQNNTGADKDYIQYTHKEFGHSEEAQKGDDPSDPNVNSQQAAAAAAPSAPAAAAEQVVATNNASAQQSAQAYQGNVRYSLGPGLVEPLSDDDPLVYKPYVLVYGPNGEVTDIKTVQGNNIFVGDAFNPQPNWYEQKFPPIVPYAQ